MDDDTCMPNPEPKQHTQDNSDLASLDISFLNPMTMYTQIILGRGMALKISDTVNDYVKRFGTTKIYNKLSKGDQIRFKTLGWREDEFNRIADQIKKHSVYKDGKYQAIGLEDWTPEARAKGLATMKAKFDDMSKEERHKMFARPKTPEQ